LSELALLLALLTAGHLFGPRSSQIFVKQRRACVNKRAQGIVTV
jgi:hypothetical protein